MNADGPITRNLIERLLECLNTVQDESQISHALFQMSGHIVNAINQLESQQRALTSTTQPCSEGFERVNDTNTGIDDFTGDPNTPQRLHLSSKWDDRLAPDNLPRIHKRNIPHVKGSEAKWIPDTPLTIACAQAFGLPLPRQIGQKAGHLITARLATDPTTGKILLIIGGYILDTLPEDTASLVKRHMSAVDSPCIQVNAKLTKGRHNTWRIIYYI